MSLLRGPYHFAKTAKFNVIDVGAPGSFAAEAQGSGGGVGLSRSEALRKEDVASSSGSRFEALSASVTRQAAAVRELKKGGASPEAIAAAAGELAGLRAARAKEGAAEALDLDRRVFEDVLIRKMFVVPAFEIHGGVSGLFDLGPPGCALKANLLAAWRRHFVLEEKMLEMECTCLTPEAVLRASGHVDRFTDLMVKDVVTGDCYRGDKLLEEAVDAYLEARKDALSAEEAEAHRRVRRQADAYAPEELDRRLRDYGVSSAAGNALTPSFAFNLMFATKIGPAGALAGYLRPETAQGLFVNFKRLLDYNGGRVPFAAAQVGLGFRNEIAPKNGLLRVREFTMAEIEHFVDPGAKAHPKFAAVADTALVLFAAEAQLGAGRSLRTTARAAVAAGLVANETLCYYMARTQLFCVKVGLQADKLRFRQHLRTEMAHYASDCWDLELLTAYGWIECAGHADRACYDLEVHARAARVALEAQRVLPEPRTLRGLAAAPNRKLIGTTFKKDQADVYAALAGLDDAALGALEKTLAAEGRARLGDTPFVVTADMVKVGPVSRQVSVEKFVPSVIEPSFGVGRLLHALLEHSFSVREGDDDQRVVMRFRPNVAPLKCGLFNLQANAAFLPVVADLEDRLTAASITSKTDTSSQAIGRRYARADELGLPFGATVDFDTLHDAAVTLRDRDSMAQVRVPIASLVDLLHALCGKHPGDEPAPWAEATKPFPKVPDKQQPQQQQQQQQHDGAPAAAAAAASASPSGLRVERTHRASFSRPLVEPPLKTTTTTT